MNRTASSATKYKMCRFSRRCNAPQARQRPAGVARKLFHRFIPPQK